MLKRILVALSGTSYTPVAIQQAVELAKLHDAEVTGVTIVDIERLSDVGPVPLGGGAAAHALADHRIEVTEHLVRQEIERFEETCRNQGVDYEVARETGDAFTELEHLWRYHDLTVIGLRGLFEFGLVKNPDDYIVKLLQAGVRPIIAVSDTYRTINRALIAYNGSHESAMAMKRFAQYNLWPGVKIKICCFGFDDDKATPLLTDATRYLRAHGYEPEAEARPGYPEEGLLKQAKEWEADLVVMGATSRRNIFKRILGETAMQAVMHAGVPLFLSQ
jgi:nucleotide-binding universal stress UspA family protein